jgi:hypothetical protein
MTGALSHVRVSLIEMKHDVIVTLVPWFLRGLYMFKGTPRGHCIQRVIGHGSVALPICRIEILMYSSEKFTMCYVSQLHYI